MLSIELPVLSEREKETGREGFAIHCCYVPLLESSLSACMHAEGAPDHPAEH